MLPGMLGQLGMASLGRLDVAAARRWFEEGLAAATRAGQRASAETLSDAIVAVLGITGAIREVERIS